MKKLVIALIFIVLLLSGKDRYDFINSVNSVYKVTTVEPAFFGSAVAINNHQVITCAHIPLASHSPYLLLEINDEYGKVITKNHLTLVKIDKEADLALFDSKEPLPYYVSVGNVSVKVGDSCYKIGSRYGIFAHDIRTGFISNTSCHEVYSDYWESSIPVIPGDSGGGIFNENHKLIGLNSAMIVADMGGWSGIKTDISAMVPLFKILKFLEK